MTLTTSADALSAAGIDPGRRKAQAVMVAVEYEGTIVHFCGCSGCFNAFRQDPERVLGLRCKALCSQCRSGLECKQGDALDAVLLGGVVGPLRDEAVFIVLPEVLKLEAGAAIASR